MEKSALTHIKTAILTLIIGGALCGGALADGELIPVGAAVGIQMKTDGVMVVDVAEVQTADGSVCPAGDAGILPGDVIVKVGKCETPTSADLVAAVDALPEGSANITVMRGGKTINLTITPALEVNGGLRLGLWLRDGLAGVGTITFIDPETGMFGALGHGVSDMDTGVLLPMSGGSVCRAQIVNVIPGTAGQPGELCGSFDGGDILGSISSNTSCGIFGSMNGMQTLHAAVPIAEDSEIQAGPAVILANVTGESVAAYDVEISRTALSGDGRSLLVHVTDPELLCVTGGIVQGMSGCPILQNGKLVGAITHVLVSDPTRGYGITIRRMLDEAAMDRAA